MSPRLPFVKVATTEEIPEGSIRHVLVHDKPIALCNVEGHFYAVNAVCPHMGGPLASGRLAGCVVTCPWHGWTFDVRTGLPELCTRRCGFCAVPKGRPAGQVDWAEPERVAQAAERMGLKYIVVTSVDRDDLKDGGSTIFAKTIEALRNRIEGCKVEVLIPDFRGSDEALRTVLEARPDVLNHNIETVPRLYSVARRGSRYERSLRLLDRSREIDPAIPTKSGLMVGLGETMEELFGVLGDLAGVGVDIVTIGQYLRPSAVQLPVARFYTPEEFATLREEGLRRGLRHVESGPLVRSSYHAHEQSSSLDSQLKQ